MFKTACVFGVMILAVGISAAGEEPTADSNTEMPVDAATVDPLCLEAQKFFLNKPGHKVEGACKNYWNLILKCDENDGVIKAGIEELNKKGYSTACATTTTSTTTSTTTTTPTTTTTTTTTVPGPNPNNATSNDTTSNATDHLLTTPGNAAMRMFHFCGFTFYAYVVAMLGRF